MPAIQSHPRRLPRLMTPPMSDDVAATIAEMRDAAERCRTMAQAIRADENAYIRDQLRTQIAAVTGRPRTFAGRWFPEATHGTTEVVTFDRAALDVLTLADVFDIADAIATTGAEPRVAFTYDAAQHVTGLAIGARVPDAALATQRADADDLLAAYRQADGDGLDEMVAQDAAERGEAA